AAPCRAGGGPRPPRRRVPCAATPGPRRGSSRAGRRTTRLRAGRGRSGRGPGRRRSPPRARSQERQPFPGLPVGEVGRVQAVPDAQVPLEVARGQSRVGLVEGLARDLVPALELLEPELVAAPVAEQPPGPRPADAVAEGDVQAEADLVDEVVHVGLVAAVVAAHEDYALVVV